MGWFGKKKEPPKEAVIPRAQEKVLTAENLRKDAFEILEKGNVADALSMLDQGITFENCVIKLFTDSNSEDEGFDLLFDKQKPSDFGEGLLDDVYSSDRPSNVYKKSPKENKRGERLFSDVLNQEHNKSSEAGLAQLKDMTDWTLMQRKRFYDDVRENNDIGIYLYPLAYFAKLGHMNVVNLLLKQGEQADEGVDNPRSTSFKKAIYYCLDNPEMMELLLKNGSQATLPMALSAFARVTSVNEEELKPLKLLVRYGVSVDSILSQVRDQINREDYIKLSQALKYNIQPVVIEPKTVASQPSAESVPTFLKYERVYDGLRVTDVYDFITAERITFNTTDGKPRVDLRQTFNAIGRADKGLQTAIADYREIVGDVDEEALFSTNQRPGQKISVQPRTTTLRP